MKKHAEKDTLMKLSESDPKVRQELKKSAKEAKEFFDKFAKSRILNESSLRKHMTV